MAETDPRENVDSTATGLSRPGAARRKLLRGGAAGTPVLLTFASPAVFGTTLCRTASAFASINASRPQVTTGNCAGQKPAWWGNSANQAQWPTSSPYRPGDTWGGLGMATHAQVPGSTTLLAVMQFADASGPRFVASHIAASLLNLKTGRVTTTATFDINIASVKKIWADYAARGFYEPSAGIKWFEATPVYPSTGQTTVGGIVGYLQRTMV